ncbi:MAG: DUF4331 family protein [Streptosporangiaceae bacterium]
MSHHLDTPLAAKTGQLYLDDLYVFGGEDSTLFIMDINSNVNGLHSEPGFHHEARYEFKVHFDGADFETLTYRVSFAEPDTGGRQAWQLHALTGETARDDSAAGELLTEGRTGETASGNGTRLWAGRIADSFYIDLSLLALVNKAVADGTAPDLSGWQPQNAANSFAGSLVYSIVLEVPHDHPQLRPGARTGVWAATKLATDAGGWRQINRAGHPMMWPIFWPNDTDFSDPSNTGTHPRTPARPSTSASRSPPSWQPAEPAMTRRVTARPSPRTCSPTCCPTWSAPPRSTGSPASTAGPRPTTHPRQCCPWSPAPRCLPGSHQPPPKTSAAAPSLR